MRKLALELLLHPNAVEPLMRQLFVQGLVNLAEVAGKSLTTAAASVISAADVADAARAFRVRPPSAARADMCGRACDRACERACVRAGECACVRPQRRVALLVRAGLRMLCTHGRRLCVMCVRTATSAHLQ